MAKTNGSDSLQSPSNHLPTRRKYSFLSLKNHASCTYLWCLLTGKFGIAIANPIHASFCLEMLSRGAELMELAEREGIYQKRLCLATK